MQSTTNNARAYQPSSTTPTLASVRATHTIPSDALYIFIQINTTSADGDAIAAAGSSTTLRCQKKHTKAAELIAAAAAAYAARSRSQPF
jgi:hypothetical protein